MLADELRKGLETMIGEPNQSIQNPENAAFLVLIILPKRLVDEVEAMSIAFAHPDGRVHRTLIS